MLTSRSKAIFTFPIRSPPPPRNFTTLCRKPNLKPILSSYIGVDASLSTSRTVSFFHRNIVFSVSRCISSISTSASTVDWNEAFVDSEAGGSVGSEEVDEIDEASEASISVRAFFISTRSELLIFQIFFCCYFMTKLLTTAVVIVSQR